MKITYNSKIILLIIFLVIMIILPPTFRVLFPRSESENKNTTNSGRKINTTLTCSTETADFYSVKYKITYKNSTVTKIVATFTDTKNDRENSLYSATTTQINFLCGLKSSTYKYVNNDLIITLTKDTYNSNKDNDTIKKMYQDYDAAKRYYKKIGYTCK